MAIVATNVLQLYTASFLYPWFLINIKLEVQFFLSFPNFNDLNAFFPNSIGPWPQLQKHRKIHVVDYKSQNYTCNLGHAIERSSKILKFGNSNLKDNQKSRNLVIQI